MFNFLPRGGKADSGHHSVLRTPDLYLEHSAPSPLRAAGTLEAHTFAGLRESLWVVVLLLSTHFSDKSPHFLLPPVVLTTGSAAILLVLFPPFHFNWFWSVKAFSEYECVFHWNQSFSASLLPPSFHSAKSRLPQIKWLRAEPALTWLQNYIAALMLLIWLDPVWPRNASLLKSMVLHLLKQVRLHLSSGGWMTKRMGAFQIMWVILPRWEWRRQLQFGSREELVTVFNVWNYSKIK